MSPRRKCMIQSTYCVRSGRSAPSCWLSAATARASASGPSTARPMSPGNSWPPANTITDNSHNVISDKPTRAPRNRATRPALPLNTLETEGGAVADIVGSCRRLRRCLRAQHRAVEIQLRESREAHAVHAFAHRDQLIVEERDDDGCLVEQQRLDLCGD